MSSNSFVLSSCSSEITLVASPLNVDGPTNVGWEILEGGMGGVALIRRTQYGGHPLCLELNMDRNVSEPFLVHRNPLRSVYSWWYGLRCVPRVLTVCDHLLVPLLYLIGMLIVEPYVDDNV
ncbi:hypothetical protein GOBAR_DD02085 [Gossypium barbadense]|nr:hypothetical protein GOBAR_DD02085 [Gossypium barbadense]